MSEAEFKKAVEFSKNNGCIESACGGCIFAGKKEFKGDGDRWPGETQQMIT